MSVTNVVPCVPQAYIEGIKDIIEPLLILLLAWALGAAIQVTDQYI